MTRRTLGLGGPVVTRIGLGLAALGRPSYINIGHGDDIGEVRSKPELERHAHAMLDAAMELGIGYVDAARSYGLAEDFLASWLGGRDAPRPTIGSKWGYTYVADWDPEAEVHEVKDHSLATFVRQREETRNRLLDAIDVYHIHSVTPDSPVLRDAAVLDALAEMKTAGIVVGLSTSGADQAETIRSALAIDRGGAPLFGSFQATWNVLEPSTGTALAEASERGIGVIVKEALANGRLAGASGAWLVERCPGASADAIALAAVLSQPWVDVVLSGASTLDQLRSNMTAESLDVTAGDLLDRAEEPGEYWATRSELSWT